MHWEQKNITSLSNQEKLISAIGTTPLKSQLNTSEINTKVNEAKPCTGQQHVTPEPAIRILKRPPNLARGQLIGGNNPKPLKSLEQRQKEYKQFRLSILGESRNPEDDDDWNWVHDKFEALDINGNQKYKKRRQLINKNTECITYKKQKPQPYQHQTKHQEYQNNKTETETTRNQGIKKVPHSIKSQNTNYRIGNRM